MPKRLGFICGEYLVEKARDDSRIWVIDGDLADSDGAEPFVLAHPNRFIAAGIAEQNMVSMAAGMATTGKKPWVFSFAAFLCYRAYDQIRVSISQAKLAVTLVGSHSGACSGRNGKTHIALNDIALMASLPYMNVWTPADAADIEFAISCILSEQAPAYLRLPRDELPAILEGNGLIRWIGEPSSIAIFSHGLSTHWALKAQKLLSHRGQHVGVLHFSKIWPIDWALLSEMISEVDTAFIIEDHYAMGGLKTCLQHIGINKRLISMCWPQDWHGQSGDAEVLLDHFQLSPAHITTKVMQHLSES